MIGVRTALRRAGRLIGIRGHVVAPAPLDTEPIGAMPPVTRPDGERPRVVIFADRPGWAHDAAARPISKLLSDEFEIRVEYRSNRPNLARWPFDLIYVLFWGEQYHHKYIHDARKIIKQAASTRWADKLTPAQWVEQYLADAGAIAVPSRKLQNILAPYRNTVLVPNGFDPEVFSVKGLRTGRLRVGWAGNRNDPCKGLKDVLIPAVGGDFDFSIAGGDLSQAEMVGFYNSVDVICVASTAEGDPCTLTEGMACGCFPVCVDVGIVPELVQSGTNGLIVERTPAAFRSALTWCHENLDQVREIGLRNAEDMLRTRTWRIVSEQWRTIMRYAYRRLDDGTSVEIGGSAPLS
jgi:glycosyltransferase involved in cell wall biosynthesis